MSLLTTALAAYVNWSKWFSPGFALVRYWLFPGVSFGVSFVNILSIFLVSSGPETNGLKGGSSYLSMSFYQSIFANQGCLFSSFASSSVEPSLLAGSLSRRPWRRLLASTEKNAFISIRFSTMSCIISFLFLE